MSDTMKKAKIELILKQPFFASLLLGLPMHEDKSVVTMGTDGSCILYNPEFVDKLTQAELVFVLAHEVLHCVFEHMHRRGARNKNRYNIAADFVINDILVSDRVGSMPKGGLHSSALVKQGKGTTEGVYDLLPESTESVGVGEEGGALDSVSDAKGDQAAREAAQAGLKVKVIQAANAAKMHGKLSSSLERLVSELTTPTVNWREVLRRFLSERAKVDWSFAKPKRRFLAQDLCLASPVGTQLGNLVVAVDCSGSVNQRMLDAFAAEIRGITQDTRPTRVDVVYFDSVVCGSQSFEQGEDVTLKPMGGGGTAFSPIWEYIAKLDQDPVACVVLTDLCCSDFGDAPSYPVLWASTDNGQVPFGEIVKVTA